MEKSEIKKLLNNYKFVELNRLLTTNEISSKDLVFDDRNSILVLVQNLERLSVNIDEVVNACGDLQQTALIETFAQNAHLIRGLPEEHINTLAGFVIEKGSLKEIISFSQWVRKAPIARLGLAVNEKGGVEDILYFVKNVSNIPDNVMDEFAKSFVKLGEYSNIRSFIEYATNLPNSTVRIFAENLVKQENIENIIEFVQTIKVPNESLKILLIPIIKTNNVSIIYRFAKNIDGKSNDVMKDIVSFVIGINSPALIYLFVANIELSIDNIKALTDAIMKIGNIEFVTYFVLSLGYKQTEEIKKLRLVLKNYLDKYGNNNWMLDLNLNLHKELEEKLLNGNIELQNSVSEDNFKQI